MFSGYEHFLSIFLPVREDGLPYLYNFMEQSSSELQIAQPENACHTRNTRAIGLKCKDHFCKCTIRGN